MEQLAHKANIEYKQLSRIELAEINTSLLSIVNLAHALKIEPKALLEYL